MPKSKTRKGHNKRVQAHKARQTGKQNKAMKEFKAKMAEFNERQKMQDGVAKQVAKESRANELIVNDDPLALPTLDYDATSELSKATNTSIETDFV